MKRRITELIVCGSVVVGATGLLCMFAFLSFAYSAAVPDDYSTGYQPGEIRYEAREFWLSIPEVAAGGEWTCDWSAFNPLDTEGEDEQ